MTKRPIFSSRAATERRATVRVPRSRFSFWCHRAKHLVLRWAGRAVEDADSRTIRFKVR